MRGLLGLRRDLPRGGPVGDELAPGARPGRVLRRLGLLPQGNGILREGGNRLDDLRHLHRGLPMDEEIRKESLKPIATSRKAEEINPCLVPTPSSLVPSLCLPRQRQQAGLQAFFLVLQAELGADVVPVKIHGGRRQVQQMGESRYNAWTAQLGMLFFPCFIMPPMKKIATRSSRSGCDWSLRIVFSSVAFEAFHFDF